MLAHERQQKILSLLDERGTVRTIDLAGEFQVTDETIRRDLNALSESEQLTKIHGGACSLNGRPKLQSFSERSILNIASKKAIANVAIDLIHPGKTYAFDSSTTAVALVSILQDLPYRVVTNAFAVLEHLSTKENVELISTGGRYHPKTHTFVGGSSVQLLRRHHINTAFISCIGFHIDLGASEGFEEQATFKEILVEHAEEVVLLMDSSKFEQQSEYYFASIPNLNHIITDSNIDPAMTDAIRSKGLKLTIAELT